MKSSLHRKGFHPDLTHIETDEDLQRDQFNFLQSTAAQQSRPFSGTPTELFIPPEDAEAAEPPACAQLPPIKERKVASRRLRKPPPSAPSFPVAPLVQKHASVFARRRADQNTEQDHSLSPPLSTPTASPVPVPSVRPPEQKLSDEARSTLANMSEEDIRAAQLELLGTVKAETVSFLKQRWKQRGLGPFCNNLVHDTQSTTPSNVACDISTSTYAREPSAAVPDSRAVNLTNLVSDFNSESGHPNSAMKDASNLLIEQQRNGDPSSATNLSNIRNSLITPNAPITEREVEKMLWMTEATTSVPSDAELDQILNSAVQAMGAIGKERFDFDGRILTEEQISSLPTHLGLHHHGISPASAGYTLTDILTLMRSTLVSQRVIALQVLSALLEAHGPAVSTPLVQSGALSLALAPFPSNSTFFHFLTNQMAYVRTVNILMRPHCFYPADRLVRDMFFMSRFYTPVGSGEVSVPMFDTLAETDCVVTLSRIAYSISAGDSSVESALLALSLIRELVVCCDDACRRLLDDEHAFSILKRFASSSHEYSAKIAIIACDVIAHVVVRLAWRDESSLGKIAESVLNDLFLREICNHLTVLLRDGGEPLSPDSILRAKGTLRVMRAGLRFQLGIMPFSSVTQPVCRLLYGDEESVSEAYLALEAYVHSLHESVASRRKRDDDERGKSGVGEARVDDEISDSFVMDQVSGLVPSALEAVKRLVGDKSDDDDSIKAAGGHYAATLFALYRIPFDQSLLALLFNVCSKASKVIAGVLVENKVDLALVQYMASISHAGARLLTRVEMEAGYIQRELDVLLKAAFAEWQYLKRFDRAVEWRPLSNACVEWLGLLGNVHCSVKCVSQAVEVLPLLSDTQVVIDLFSRCVLRVEALQALDGKISVDDARKCATDLLPVMFEGLTNLSSKPQSGSVVTESKGDSDIRPVLVSVLDVFKFWTEKSDSIPSFLRVCSAFLKADIVDAEKLMEFLLHLKVASFEPHEDGFFSLLFAASSKAALKGGKLIVNREDSIVSMVSTTPDSELTKGILHLAGHLIMRGPQTDLTEGGSSSVDALASVVLSLMCRRDADVSMRVSLWKQTVVECGGAALFAGAKFLGHDANEPFVEDEEVLSGYVRAFASGSLYEHRCPPIVSSIMMDQLCNAITNDSNGDALHMLSQVISQSRDSKAFITMSALIERCPDHRSSKVVSEWLNTQMKG